MNKNTLLPIAIIVAGLVIGGAVFFSGRQGQLSADKNLAVANVPQNARLLTISIPNMACAGCAASIEGYVKAMPGVIEGSVSLTTKSGQFIYDPSKVTKEAIVKNTIFDIYKPIITSDEPYDPRQQQIAKTGNASIPLEIQKKSNRVSQLIVEKKQGENIEIHTKLNEVNNLIQAGRYKEAEGLIDEIIKQLENL